MARSSGAILLFVLFGPVACGGSSGSSSPAAPTPSVQGVTITVDGDLFHVGSVHTFSATAALSNGSTTTVSGGVWGGDNPEVATVEASTGRVTIVGSGQVTVWVDYRGMRGTKLIRGLPDYQGAWSGSYAIVSCAQTGDFATVDFCSGFSPNRVFPTNLALTQDSDRVSGRAFLGQLAGDATGFVQTDGQLLMTAQIREDTSTIETSWQLQSATAGRTSGGLSFAWRAAGLSGDIRVVATIRDLNRTSSLAAPRFAPPGSLRGGLEGVFRALLDSGS